MFSIKRFSTLMTIGSMLLASCNNQSTEKIEPVEKPATIRIGVSGTNLLSRAAGNPSITNESKIGQGIIFVFKGNIANPPLDGKTTFDFSSGVTAVDVNITAGSYRHIYVIANVNPANFSNVLYRDDLYNVLNKLQISSMRSGTNLAMSGFVPDFDATAATVGTPLPVNVQLAFVGSRIHVDWDLTQAPTEMLSMAVSKVFLINARDKSDFFAPTGKLLTENTNSFLYGRSDISGFTGSLLPPSSPTAYNNYDSGFAMSDVTSEKGFNNNHFYIFENNSTSATSVVIETTLNGTTYYYTVSLNSDQNGNGTGGNTGDGSFKVVRGKVYKVKAIIKGFGTSDPYAPTKKGALEIQITPANWDADIFIDQEFS